MCIVAVWVNREVIFTLLASAGFMAIIIPLNYEGYVTTAKSYETRVVSRYLAERTKPPVMLATIVPVVTPVRTGYRPDCANRIDLRDSNIFTQHKLLEEALNSKTPKEGL